MKVAVILVYLALASLITSAVKEVIVLRLWACTGGVRFELARGQRIEVPL